MLLGFVLLGRFLEERARFRTGRALEDLARLQPDSALLVFTDGVSREVSVGGLRPGDRVRLLPGDRVPVDGVVLEGASAVDVSSLTGEPVPLEAEVGTELVAGMLNLQAPLELEVRHIGSKTALARIIALVEQAQARKAPIQSLADRVAGRFTGLVILLAVATFLFWWLCGTRIWPHVLMVTAHQALVGHAGMTAHSVLGSTAETPFSLALQLAIAVLVVACPCALGLATPTAITVGSGLAARSGLLFRGGDAIEMASRLHTLLFDKTGTLTLGRPLVIAVEPASPEPGGSGAPDGSDRLIQIAASLERQTRHPLAHALLQEAQRRGVSLLEAHSSRTRPGAGVEGELVGEPGLCHVGRPDWLRDLGFLPAPALQERLEALEAEGSTVMAVAASSRLLGLVAVQDQPRVDAARALEELRLMGLRVGVLSGDRSQAVKRLGARLGIGGESLAWELLPEQKLEHILRWRQHGPVGMVGDGINDAPALAAADLGIAVGTGTQIAQDTADLVILGDRLEGVVEALLLARRTIAKVRQNLAWAFGYNLIVLPIAAGALLPGFGVLLSPPLAALLMATSSVTVVVNALLLHGRT
jgi:Cu2+-exporting ATPase